MDAGIDLLTHAVVSAETGLWGRETGAYTGVGAPGRCCSRAFAQRGWRRRRGAQQRQNAVVISCCCSPRAMSWPSWLCEALRRARLAVRSDYGIVRKSASGMVSIAPGHRTTNERTLTETSLEVADHPNFRLRISHSTVPLRCFAPVIAGPIQRQPADDAPRVGSATDAKF